MGTLLILTVGQTDVQLVVNDTRREFCKKHCAVLHDEMERRVESLCLVDAPDTKVKGKWVGEFPEGKITLCTPKLDAVLRYFDKHSIHLAAVLLLETRRDTSAESGDPRFAGAILENRLRSKGIETVVRCAYLEGKERLEDWDQPRDAVIRREVVRRLENAVRETLEKVEPSRVVVAPTGGFPVVGNLVEEIARLHARPPVEALEAVDRSKATPPTGDCAVSRTSTPEPLVSFQARRRALELISAGNLLGAWAIAEPLHEDKTERRWTEIVEWLALFSSSLPMSGSCDIDVLRDPRMAVRTAIRVELALLAGDIPRAIHGTVAFFESALWDGLLERVEPSKEPEHRRYFKIKTGDAPCGKKLLQDGSDDDRTRPFKLKKTIDGVDWYWIFDGDGGPAARLAERFLERSALMAFDKALGSGGIGIRAMRNDVAHNEPTPELMKDARTKMQKAGLWSNADTFLSQPLVQAVLCELNEKSPEALCKDLIALVRRRLLEPA